MAHGMITRTVNHCLAFGWVIDGTNEDGSPRMVKTEGVSFMSTNPSKREAYRALRAQGFKVAQDYVDFDTIKIEVIGMDLDTFVQYGVPVDRTENGRVRPVTNE